MPSTAKGPISLKPELLTMGRTCDGSPKPQGATRSCRRRPADLAIPTLADQLAIQKAKKDANSFSGVLFLFFLERAESVDHIIVLQMAPCIRAYPVAAPLIVCGLARVWAAKMGKAVTSSFCKWPHHPASVEVAAESWRFPPLSL